MVCTSESIRGLQVRCAPDAGCGVSMRLACQKNSSIGNSNYFSVSKEHEIRGGSGKKRWLPSRKSTSRGGSGKGHGSLTIKKKDSYQLRKGQRKTKQNKDRRKNPEEGGKRRMSKCLGLTKKLHWMRGEVKGQITRSIYYGLGKRCVLDQGTKGKPERKQKKKKSWFHSEGKGWRLGVLGGRLQIPRRRGRLRRSEDD